MTQGTIQRISGDVGHSHPGVVHTHDHFHVSHHRRGVVGGVFDHQTHYHVHEHHHALLVHDASAHTHHHDAPIGS